MDAWLHIELPIFGLVLWQVLLLIFGTCLAAIVRGFAGFGDALVFLPIAGMLYSPILAILLFTLIATPGPLRFYGRAFKIVDKSLLYPIAFFMVVTLPIGFWGLNLIDENSYKWALGVLTLSILSLMALGWHPDFSLSRPIPQLVGMLAGTIGGLTGVPGVFFLFYFLNTKLRAADIRALSTLLLGIYDLIVLLAWTAFGFMTKELFFVGVLLIPIYMLASEFGQYLFSPDKERLFRRIALLIILCTGLAGLPVPYEKIFGI